MGISYHFARFKSFLRQPSAWIPLGMSLAALALVLGHALVYGIVHETDKDAAAHTWQILMARQLSFLAYFSLKWLPKGTWEALQVVAIFAATWLANFAGVFLADLGLLSAYRGKQKLQTPPDIVSPGGVVMAAGEFAVGDIIFLLLE